MHKKSTYDGEDTVWINEYQPKTKRGEYILGLNNFRAQITDCDDQTVDCGDKVTFTVITKILLDERGMLGRSMTLAMNVKVTEKARKQSK